MFFDGSGKDEDIVYIYDNSFFSDEVGKKVIYHVLEGSGCIGESEEHNIWLKKLFVGNKHYLPLVSVFDTYVIIATLKVKLHEDNGVYEFVNKFRDER